MDNMTLEDYFAAKALQGLLANPNTGRNIPYHAIAKTSYEFAQAMVKAKEEPNGKN